MHFPKMQTLPKNVLSDWSLSHKDGSIVGRNEAEIARRGRSVRVVSVKDFIGFMVSKNRSEHLGPILQRLIFPQHNCRKITASFDALF